MKKIILFIPALLFGILSFSQSWEWVRTSSSGNSDYSDNICVDNSGNIFVMGQTRTEITFGTITLSSTKERFGYLVKYNPNGDVLWAKKIIDSDDAYYELMSLTTDQNGNIAVVGYFEDTQTILDEEFTSNGSGWRDAFIFKLNANGEKQWIKTGGGDLDNNAFDVVCDNDGNFYVVADFIREATFGTFTVSADDVNLNNEIVIIKYLSDGTVDWVTQAGGLSFDNPTGIAYDGNDLFITGYFSSTDAVFGSYIVDCEEVTSIFIAQLDPADGSFDWVKVIESGLSVTSLLKEENCHIVVDDNSIYLSGYYADHAVFDETTSLDNTGENGFLASFSKIGDLNWVHEVEADDSGLPYSLSIAGNNIYMVGNYITSVTISGTELIGTPPGGMFPNLSNAYIYSFSTTGDVNWAKSINAYYAASYDAGSPIVNGIAAFGDYVYASGDFSKTIEFPPFEVTSNNSVDVFLAKIDILGNRVESIRSDENINIYPNPAIDFVNIKFKSHDNQLLTITDISGKEVIRMFHKNSDVEQINISSLKMGVYILTIISDNEAHSIMFTKN